MINFIGFLLLPCAILVWIGFGPWVAVIPGLLAYACIVYKPESEYEKFCREREEQRQAKELQEWKSQQEWKPGDKIFLPPGWRDSSFKYEPAPEHDRRVCRGADKDLDAFLNRETGELSFFAVGWNPNTNRQGYCDPE